MSIAGKSALKEKAVGIKNTLEINIEQNVLELNQGTGLILKKCFNASIIGNKFYSNLLNGADLTDFDGFIMMNNFYKNKGTGLLLETVEESNEAKIFNNFFDENYQNGIEITGKNNYSIISQNSKICNNYLNGIYVHDLANPEIKYNKIYNNSHHGILIESNSCADVNLNEIHHNVRTNIAFGGKMTNKTHITNNEIYSSRNEGVYVVEADGGEIGKNNIYDNNDGIVLIKCTEIYIAKALKPPQILCTYIPSLGLNFLRRLFRRINYSIDYLLSFFIVSTNKFSFTTTTILMHIIRMGLNL